MFIILTSFYGTSEGLDKDMHFSGKILVHPLFAGFIGKEESASGGKGAE